MKSWSVELIGQNQWRPYLENFLSKHSGSNVHGARTLISAMHNRHIAITPRLALELSDLLQNTNSRNRKPGVWTAVIRRLNECLASHERRESLSGILLHASPTYTVIRLAQPLVEEACKRLGQGILFAEDNPSSSQKTTAYHAWSEALYREVEEMTRDQSPTWSTFWMDRALTLANYSHRPSQTQTNKNLPKVHGPSLNLLLNLNAPVAAARHKERHPKPLRSAQKHREAMRLKEGGVHGVKMSRKLQDMGEMLLSEFMRHPIIQADRLLNTGYLSYRREPRKERLRDVLIVGVMPHQARMGPMAQFTKACWFELCARLSYMLYKNNMMNSEFRWLEGDLSGGIRQASFLLKDLPQTGQVEGETPHQLWRTAFLKATGWSPAFLDHGGEFQPLPSSTLPDLESETPMFWLQKVWAFQKDHQRWNNHQPAIKNRDRLTQDAWSHTHLMVFQPTANQDITAAQLHRKLRFNERAGVSLTHIPDQTTSPEWRFQSLKSSPKPLFSSEENQLSATAAAGRVVQSWLDLIVKEIRHV